MVSAYSVLWYLTTFGVEEVNMQTAPAKTDTLWHVYVGCSIAVCTLIVLIFFNRGFFVVMGVLMYIMSLSTMTLSVKWVFVREKFNFPLFLTSTHFFFCGILCFAIMKIRELTGGKSMLMPTRKQIMKVIVPIATCFTANVAANNIALVHCNAAFAEMLGAATPICLVWINAVEGKGFNRQLYTPVLMVVGGVCMCVSGEIHFTWIGFILIWIAVIFRAFRQHLQGKIMEHNTDVGTLEPIELLAWMSLPCFAMILSLGCAVEGIEPYFELYHAKGPNLIMAIGISIVNAMILNIANNFVIRDLGAMGCTLAGQLKIILLFMGAAVLLGENIQRRQIAGYCLTTCGVYYYNRTDMNIGDSDKTKDLESLHEKVSLALQEDEAEKMPLVSKP